MKTHYDIAREYLDQLITDQLRSMYRHAYGTGFFWGFVTALVLTVALYSL